MKDVFENIMDMLRNAVDKECVSSVPKVRLCDALSIVKKAKENYNNEWISVKKRLPDHHDDVLVQYNNGEMGTAWYQGKSDWCSEEILCSEDLLSVVAWQPLPGKYKEA